MGKSIFGLFVGGAVLFGLFVWHGIAPVVDFLAEAGAELFLVCLLAPLEQWMAAESWRALFRTASKPTHARILLASWMGSAINSLLPVATVGGELAKARTLILWGHPVSETIAATAIDKIVQAFAILIWSILGVGVLGAASAGFRPILSVVVVAAVVFVIGIGVFGLVLFKGGFSRFFAVVAKRLRPTVGVALVENAVATEQAIREICRSPANVTKAVALRLAQRSVYAVEIALIGYLMAHPIGMSDTIILSGLVGAIRLALFAVPSGIGVQEGGYVAVGALLGYPPDFMIAVSLVTRIREILTSLPFFLSWQVMEGRAMWGRWKN